jgi:hypothetical protein
MALEELKMRISHGEEFADAQWTCSQRYGVDAGVLMFAYDADQTKANGESK